MKKFLTTSNNILKAGLAAKGIVDTVLSPIASLRNLVKKAIIKSMVYLVKKSVNLTMKDKVNADSNIIVQQLNALTDSQADVSKINKNIQFQVTLDTLVEKVDEVEEYKILKYIDLTKAKNKFSAYKNSMRNDIYDYMSENSFSNISSLVNSVNEVLKMPTEIVGCEFVNTKVTVDNHDEINKDFVLIFDVNFCIKSSS